MDTHFFNDFSTCSCCVYNLYQCLSSIRIYDLRPDDPKVDDVALLISRKSRVGHQTEIKIPIILYRCSRGRLYVKKHHGQSRCCDFAILILRK